MTRKVFISLIVLFGLGGFATGATILVPEDYTTIQGAINAAVNGDEVLVADGTWTGVGNRGIDFYGKSITVHSQNGPANCIIDCQNVDQAFFFHSGEDETSVVEGFTITRGVGNFGGAIECSGSEPTIRDCVFFENTANYYGGAIECYGASPKITSCLFYDNGYYYGWTAYGGAIDCEDASPVITNCTFSFNYAGYDGGAIFSSWYSSPQVVNCVFEMNFNHAIHEYAATLTSDVTVTNCLFYDNFQGAYYDADTDTVYADANETNGIPDGYASNNIDGEPLFRTGPFGDFYLSQTSAEQLNDSPCLDAGSGSAFDIFGSASTHTTRTDNVQDTNSVDIGYHYPNSGSVVSYRLQSYVNGANGTISPQHDWPGVEYIQFAEVALTATPDMGYKVSGWAGGTDDDYSVDPNNIVTMNQSKTITVSFEPRNQYDLTVSIDGMGGRIKVFSPDGTYYDEAYPGYDVLINVYEEQVVRLEAIPDPNHLFKKWHGTDNDSSSELINYVTVESHQQASAEFITEYVHLEVTWSPFAAGWIRPRSGDYPVGTQVELTLSINPGYEQYTVFWSETDDDSSHELTNTVTMDDNKNVHVQVTFICWLHLSAIPTSDGWVHGVILDPLTGQPATDPDTGWTLTTQQYPRNTWVHLTAQPEPGYEVAKWTWHEDDHSSYSWGNHAWVRLSVLDTSRDKYVSVRFKQISQLPGRICVYAPAPDGEPDWAHGPKNCYNTIQEAIDANDTLGGISGPYIVEGDPEATPVPIPEIPESPGDIVVVKDGRYRGAGNWDLDFKGKLITVRSEFGPENCFIDCNSPPSDPHQAFIFTGTGPGLGDVEYNKNLGIIKVPGAENNGAVINGFTIMGGYAEFGGGISVGGIAAPLITNCIIRENSANLGGGGVSFEGLDDADTSWEDLAVDADAAAATAEDDLAALDPSDANSIPLAEAAELARTIAIITQQIVDSIGADDADRATLTDCKILYNRVGDTMPGDGGGIYCLNSAPIFINCDISRNTAGFVTLGFGGGVYCETSPAEFINCLVTHNWSSEIGGAFYLADTSDAIIRLSTIAYNHSEIVDPDSALFETLDGICADESGPTINNCIIYHVGGIDLYECDAEASWVEDENLYQSPGWTPGPLGPYYLSQPPAQGVISPCVNAGDTGVLQELQNPPDEEDGYGLALQITTSVANAYDGGAADQGYHYPFWTGPPIRCRLRIYVHNPAGTLDYNVSGSGLPRIGTVTSGTYADYTCNPGTTVSLTAFPDPGYRVLEWEGTDLYPFYGTTNSVTVYYDSVQNQGGYKIVELWFEETFPRAIHVPGEKAYINEAIDVARDGDIIFVGPGTFPGTGYAIWGKNITITAMNPTDRDDPALATIIDCTNDDGGGFHLIGDGHGSILLNGFVIQTSSWWHAGNGFDGADIEDDIAGTPGMPGGTFNPRGFGGWPGWLTGLGGHDQAWYPESGITVYGNHTVANCTVRGFYLRAG
ncbi:MAG: InlB B-repeat-containing protein, partial [Planctomycetota bacterium]